MWELQETRKKCRSIRENSFRLEQRPIGMFLQLVRNCATSSGTLIEIGCGRRGHFLRTLAADFRQAYGVDLEVPAIIQEGNVTLLPGDATDVPLPDASADVIVSIDVFEHLADPPAVLRECHRLLRPGGHIIIMTPNSAYPPLVLGRLLPHWLRAWFNLVLTGTRHDDTFPAFYRANSVTAVAEAARGAGLRSRTLDYVMDHPHYLMFSVWVYRLGILLERLFLRPRPLACLRHSLVCHLQKPPARRAARKRQSQCQRPHGQMA